MVKNFLIIIEMWKKSFMEKKVLNEKTPSKYE